MTGTAAPGPIGLLGHAAVGGLCGLAWSAGLRGWMIEIAGRAESTFSWMTLVLILMPGAAVGVLIGLAAHHRAAGSGPPRAFVLAPLLFACGLLNPALLWALIHTGQSGGALLMGLTAMAGGHALTRSGRPAARVATTAVAVLGIAAMGALALVAAPLSSPRGAWVAVLGASLTAVLCLAATLTRPPSGRRTGVAWYVAAGGLCGLAWSASLRSLLLALDGGEPALSWLGTFGGVLLPGLVAGALLGRAAAIRRAGGRAGGRLLALAPLTLIAIQLGGIVTVSGQALEKIVYTTAPAVWVTLLNGSLLVTAALATVFALRAGGAAEQAPASGVADPGATAPAWRSAEAGACTAAPGEAHAPGRLP